MSGEERLEILSRHVDGEQPGDAALDRALAHPDSGAVLADFQRIGQALREAAGAPSVEFLVRVERELVRATARSSRARRAAAGPVIAALVVAAAAVVTWFAVRAPQPHRAPAKHADPARPAAAPTATVALWGHVQVVPSDSARPTLDEARRVAGDVAAGQREVTRSRVSANANEVVARVGLAWQRLDVHAVDLDQIADVIAGFQVVSGLPPDRLPSSSAAPIYIGRHAAHLLGAVTGDELRLELADQDRPVSTAAFRIAGIVDTGIAHLDRTLAVVPIDAVATLPLSPTISLWIREPARVDETVTAVRDRLSGARWSASATRDRPVGGLAAPEVAPSDLWHLHMSLGDLTAALATGHVGLDAFPAAVGEAATSALPRLLARFRSLDRSDVVAWVELSSSPPITVGKLSFFFDDGGALLAHLVRTWGEPVRGDELGRPLSIWIDPTARVRVIARAPGRPGSVSAADDDYAIEVEPYARLEDLLGPASSDRFGIERLPLVGASLADVQRAYADVTTGSTAYDFPPVEWGAEPVSLRLELDAAGDRVTSFELELDVRYAPARVADLRARTRAKLGRSRLVKEQDGERVYAFPDHCHIRLTTASVDRHPETIWTFVVGSRCP